MNKYVVKVEIVQKVTFHIRARSPEKAESKVRKMLRGYGDVRIHKIRATLKCNKACGK